MQSIMRLISLLLLCQVELSIGFERVVRSEAPHTKLTVDADGAVKPWWPWSNRHQNNEGALVEMSVSASGQTAEVLTPSLSDEDTEQSAFSKRVQSLLDAVEEMAQSDKDPEIDAINEIKDIITTALLPGLKTARDEAEQQLKTHINSIKKCNANALSKYETQKLTIAEVDGLRKSHAACRKQEKDKTSHKDAACKTLDNFLDGIVEPAKFPTTHARDARMNYCVGMTDYFCPKGETCSALEKACAAAEQGISSCHPLQAHFESGFCTLKADVDMTCVNLETCYNPAVKKYEEYKLKVEVALEDWKVESWAVNKLLCYVDVLLHSSNSTEPEEVNPETNMTATEEKFQACDDGNWETDQMDIEFQDTPAKVECSDSAVQNYPGTDAFLNEYKDFAEQVAPVTACLPEVIRTSGTTTTPKPVDPPSKVAQGIHRFRRWAGGIKCQWIFFDQPFAKAPLVHATIDHRTHTKRWVHHSTTVWLQQVYPDRFKACVRELGHHGKGAHDNNCHVAYMAFSVPAALPLQLAPGATLGSASWEKWNKDEKKLGYKCEWIDYGNAVTLNDPKALITPYHDPKHGGNAITDWIQEIEPTRLHACIRETRHHDNWHMAMNMAYLVWDQPIPGTQDGRYKFNSWDRGTKCNQVKFPKAFSKAPVVQVSINHFYAPDVINDALTVWLEEVDTTGFEVCCRELAYKKYKWGAHAEVYVDWLAREELA